MSNWLVLWLFKYPSSTSKLVGRLRMKNGKNVKYYRKHLPRLTEKNHIKLRITSCLTVNFTRDNQNKNKNGNHSIATLVKRLRQTNGRSHSWETAKCYHLSANLHHYQHIDLLSMWYIQARVCVRNLLKNKILFAFMYWLILSNLATRGNEATKSLIVRTKNGRNLKFMCLDVTLRHHLSTLLPLLLCSGSEIDVH